MPCSLAFVPRTMLPPPITSPTSAPISCSDWISSVSRSTTGGEMPKPCSPARASPLSLSTMRRYFRSAPFMTGRSLAQHVTSEPAHHDVFARLPRYFRDQLLHSLIGILHER